MSGTRLVFQDTSVLINLHRAGLLPALGRSFGDDLRWVATVRVECSRKERHLGLPGLTSSADAVLGDPLCPDQMEHRSIRLLRAQMAAPGDHPDEHLGEAETITIISARGIKAALATDDRSAMAMARPVPCMTTWTLLRLMIRKCTLRAEDALRVWDAVMAAGGHPPRDIPTRVSFEELLQEE